MGLALALPLTLQSQCKADTLNVSQAQPQIQSQPTELDIAAQVHDAKDRLETAKIRLDIAKKQVEASKARQKAAEAEFKAAKANHEARNLEHQAQKLSESSGLPAISEQLIEENRNHAVASKFPFMGAKQEKVEEQAEPKEQKPVDLSETRIQQVDFNAQPFDKSNGEPQSQQPGFRSGQKVSSIDDSSMTQATTVAPGLVATGSTEPPIVP